MADEQQKQRLNLLHTAYRSQDPDEKAAHQREKDEAKRLKLQSAMAASGSLYSAATPRLTVATGGRGPRAYTQETYAGLTKEAPPARIPRLPGRPAGEEPGGSGAGWGGDGDAAAARPPRAPPLVNPLRLRFLTWNSRAVEYAGKALEQAGAEYESCAVRLAQQPVEKEAGAPPASHAHLPLSFNAWPVV